MTMIAFCGWKKKKMMNNVWLIRDSKKIASYLHIFMSLIRDGPKLEKNDPIWDFILIHLKTHINLYFYMVKRISATASMRDRNNGGECPWCLQATMSGDSVEKHKTERDHRLSAFF